MRQPMLKLSGTAKTFILHNQNGIRLPVFENLALTVETGECVALAGPSGMGKSTLMRMIYGNYLCDAGQILLNRAERGTAPDWLDIAAADPHAILAARRWTMGYISQFLRVVPRVSTLDVVAEPLTVRGVPEEEARERAGAMLSRVNLPVSLWDLAPATFSGGEQQRVNIARGFVAPYPVMLLDEPTASLDRENRMAVLDLIEEAKDSGCAMLGIFHDADTRAAVCNREFSIGDFKVAA